VLVQEVYDMVRVKVEVFHDFLEEVLLNLGEGKEQVLDPEVVVLSVLALFYGGVQYLAGARRKLFFYFFEFGHGNLFRSVVRTRGLGLTSREAH